MLNDHATELRARSPLLLVHEAPTRKPRFRSMADLRDVPPEPPWLWRGYLADGNLTMLTGAAFSGKSTLVSGLLKALESGESFLGQQTSAATALLVSEESDVVLRQRASLFNLFEQQSEFLSRSDALLLPWPRLIEVATERALERGHRLLVIDTFATLARLGPELENDAGAVSEKLAVLQEAAAAGPAVLFLHHVNGYQQPRGSSAFRASADISIRLLANKSTDSFRLLTESRFSDVASRSVHARLAITDGRARYVASESNRGDSGGRDDTDTRLWAALLAAERCLTYADIDRIEGLSADKAKKRLPTWFKEGRVGHTGAGTKADPFCWYSQAA